MQSLTCNFIIPYDLQVSDFGYFFCYMTMEINLSILLSLWVTGLSLYLLIKNKLPAKKEILLSVIFALLVAVSYAGLQRGIRATLLNGIVSGVPTLFCSLALFSVMQKHTEIKLISTGKKNAPLISILIAVVSGLILASVNCLFMAGSNTVDFGISFSRLLICLSPAIYEEIACRSIFWTFCVYMLGNEKPTKFQQFTILFMMSFPHTVAHNYDIVSTILLCILFGLPFTFLQKKRDITSAMISHGLVDAIRFTIFGLGL